MRIHLLQLLSDPEHAPALIPLLKQAMDRNPGDPHIVVDPSFGLTTVFTAQGLADAIEALADDLKAFNEATVRAAEATTEMIKSMKAYVDLEALDVAFAPSVAEVKPRRQPIPNTKAYRRAYKR